jgi:hypothetical protein
MDHHPIEHDRATSDFDRQLAKPTGSNIDLVVICLAISLCLTKVLPIRPAPDPGLSVQGNDDHAEHRQQQSGLQCAFSREDNHVPSSLRGKTQAV